MSDEHVIKLKRKPHDCLCGVECSSEKIEKAMSFIEQYGQIDGDHHKTWVLDQVARALKGDKYEAWVVEMMDGEDGPDTYGYEEGIAP